MVEMVVLVDSDIGDVVCELALGKYKSSLKLKARSSSRLRSA